jgi:hypothetical protein
VEFWQKIGTQLLIKKNVLNVINVLIFALMVFLQLMMMGILRLSIPKLVLNFVGVVLRFVIQKQYHIL